jgi:ABC-type antimicrobial peptide transport system ATPase subunit
MTTDFEKKAALIKKNRRRKMWVHLSSFIFQSAKHCLEASCIIINIFIIQLGSFFHFNNKFLSVKRALFIAFRKNEEPGRIGPTIDEECRTENNL